MDGIYTICRVVLTSLELFFTFFSFLNFLLIIRRSTSTILTEATVRSTLIIYSSQNDENMIRINLIEIKLDAAGLKIFWNATTNY